MKPCAQHREDLVWLSLGELDPEESRLIRAHLSVCPDCRGYFEGMSSLSKSLGSQANPSSIQASEAFHHRVVARIKSQPRHTFWQIAADVAESFVPNWRFLVPASATALMILALAVFQRPKVVAPSHQSTPLVKSEVEPAAIARVALADYLMVANRSLDSLDELLTKQGEQRNPSPDPLYTASVISDWNTQN